MNRPDELSSSPNSGPSPATWSQLGLEPVAELHAGYQSRVFLAVDPAAASTRLVVKLIEAGPDAADDATRRRIEIVHHLAQANPVVVGPVERGDDLATEVDGWLVAAYPFVDGRPPRVDDRSEVEAMARVLASLHTSLATVDGRPLPPVAALAEQPARWLDGRQIIHGDFAPSNIIVTRSGLRVIDFSDCGRGSLTFEIGNTLYMSRFDAWNDGQPDRYHRFRSWFVGAYAAAASDLITGAGLDDETLDEAMAVRGRALGRWLADPARAPTGIRNSSAAWRDHLQTFVDDLLR